MQPDVCSTALRRARGALGGGVLAALLGSLVALPACTHDFSAFDTSGSSDGSGPGGGGGGGSGGASGATSAGGAGLGATGAAGGGGISGSGGVGTSGGSAGAITTGGTSNAGGARATGGATAAGGSVGAGGTGPDAGLPRCAAKYGAAAGYVLCTETATSCRFAANTAGGNCNTLCGTFGGACLDQDDNGTVPCTATTPADDCTTPRQSAICVCAR